MQTKEPARLRYVLITPARNEAAFIEQTLRSMVSQSVLPLKWIIVSDGSTDRTDEIVKRFADQHEWIELVRMPEREQRDFAGKVRAFDAGYVRVAQMKFDVIGNLDADSTFCSDYIEYLLEKFARYPRLGVAGTNYIEETWDETLKHDYRFSSIEDVTGQCQLFRRECFEAIGGYKPSKNGGVDLVATVAARMHGWETRVFTGRVLVHNRQQGTAQANRFLVEFQNGRKDRIFGSHPVWEMCRATYRLTKKPFLLGGVLLFAGYTWAALTGAAWVVSPEMARFRRREQMNRLRRILRRLFTPGRRQEPQDDEPQLRGTLIPIAKNSLR